MMNAAHVCASLVDMGIGIENIEVMAPARRNVLVVNTPDANAESGALYRISVNVVEKAT